MSDNSGNSGASFIYLLFSIATAMVGHAIHGSVGWSIVDFFFPIIVWIKWLICQEVNTTIIHNAFSFLG
jgi:hypothetical protein